jgi:glycerol-3-phosphate O-acyltransferase
VGDPHTLADDERLAAVAELGDRLMAAIGRQVPALPVSLVAMALRQAGPDGLDALSLKARVEGLIDALEAGGAHVHVPRSDRDYAVTAGMRMLELRHIVKLSEDGFYRVAPGEQDIVAYYANSIAHLLPTKVQSRQNNRR